MKCTDCHGAGNVLLLTTAKPCPRCGGTGSVIDPIREEVAADGSSIVTILEAGAPGMYRGKLSNGEAIWILDGFAQARLGELPVGSTHRAWHSGHYASGTRIFEIRELNASP